MIIRNCLIAFTATTADLYMRGFLKLYAESLARKHNAVNIKLFLISFQGVADDGLPHISSLDYL